MVRLPRIAARSVIACRRRERVETIAVTDSRLDAAMPAVLAANESLLETIANTGLPWWATILGATCILRTSMTLPIAIYQQRIVGRMIELAPLVQSWAAALKTSVATESKKANWSYQQYDAELQKQYRRKVKEVYAHYGCQRWKLFLLPYVQMPLFISMSLTLRHMTGLALPWFDEPAGSPLKGLSQGGFGWVTDLTLPDPTWTFPLLIGAGNLINVELNAWFARGQQSTAQKFITNFFRCVSIAFVPIAAYAPMAIGLYWCTSSWYSVVQNVAFRSPFVRQKLKLPPLPQKKPYFSIANHSLTSS